MSEKRRKPTEAQIRASLYDKPNAPRKTRYLQRWCNNKIIFRAEPNFEMYNPKRGKE